MFQYRVQIFTILSVTPSYHVLCYVLLHTLSGGSRIGKGYGRELFRNEESTPNQQSHRPSGRSASGRSRLERSTVPPARCGESAHRRGKEERGLHGSQGGRARLVQQLLAADRVLLLQEDSFSFCKEVVIVFAFILMVIVICDDGQNR